MGGNYTDESPQYAGCGQGRKGQSYVMVEVYLNLRRRSVALSSYPISPLFALVKKRDAVTPRASSFRYR